MSQSSTLQPDPSAIGGIAKAPFALLPRPDRLFAERATRFERLAEDSPLAAYLRFLAGIARIQAALVGELAPPEPIGPEQAERARAAAMPPLDRHALAGPGLRDALAAFLQAAEGLEKPPAAAQALARLKAADEAALSQIFANLADSSIPPEALAEHLFASAALQVMAARLAAGLDARRLVPVKTGVCPVCGGPPAASLVVGFQGADGARYAACSCCGTLWNEVRVTCLACGSTKGVGYRSVEAGEEATVKAEVCDMCHSWVKILYQNRNPALEAIADDVASLGLDLLMRDTDYRRAGFDPYLLGY